MGQQVRVFEELASRIQARKNCIVSGNSEWLDRHTDVIEQIVSDYMPSGSGFNSGTKIDLDASHADKLVFYTAFHHMNDVGYYEGWTDHTVTVTPTFVGRYHVRISGRNQNDIKDHIHETFDYSLCTLITWDEGTQRYRAVKETE